MMKKIMLGLLVLVVTFGFKSINDRKAQTIAPTIQYELSGGAGYYNYAPSVIENEYNIRYAFLCQNKNPFEIVDYVYLYKGVPSKEGYKWQPGTELIGPSDEGWDTHHICDPDVREFKVSYNGEEYNWIMTYLGVDQWHNHNQIGLAYSKSIEGPWIKFDQNPLISYEDRTTWGVGQSTSIVIDSTTIRLFYSSTLIPGKNFVYRDIKLDDLNNIEFGEEKNIPGMFTNNYPAFSRNHVFIVSEEIRKDDYDIGIPTWIGNYSVLRYLPITKDLSTPVDEWIEIGHVGPNESGFPRNHNPGILTDSKGYMLNENELIMYFTTAVISEDWLWSYDLYSAHFDLEYYFMK